MKALAQKDENICRPAPRVFCCSQQVNEQRDTSGARSSFHEPIVIQPTFFSFNSQHKSRIWYLFPKIRSIRLQWSKVTSVSLSRYLRKALSDALHIGHKHPPGRIEQVIIMLEVKGHSGLTSIPFSYNKCSRTLQQGGCLLTLV